MVSSLPTQGSVTPEDVQTQPSLGFQLVFGLASLVVGNTLLLPIQIAIIDPAHQISIFAILVGVGALAAVIANPLVGALGDRTSSRWGKRRPWIIGSTLTLLLAFFILARATTIWQLALGAVLAQFVLGSLIASLTAIIPEQIAVGRRATMSALFPMATFIGGAISQILVAQVLKGGIADDYLVLGVLALILISALLLVLRERPVAVKDAISRPLSNLGGRHFGYIS